MFFSSRSKDPRWPHLRDLLNKISKSHPDQYESLFPDLFPVIPDFTDRVFKDCWSKFLEVLGSDKFSQNTRDIVLNLVFKAVEAVDNGRKETSPFSVMFGSQILLSILFSKELFLDLRVIRIIQALHLADPKKIHDFILKQPVVMVPMIKAVSSSSDINIARLIQMIICSSIQLKNEFIPIIKNELPKWPPSIVIDFWIAEKETISAISTSDVEDWLLQHQVYSVSDIEQVFRIHPFIWENVNSLVLLSRTFSPEKPSSITWLKKQAPQLFNIPEPIARLIQNSFTLPVSTPTHSDTQDTKALYQFIRFYLLSLCNPNDIDLEIHSIVFQSLFENNEYISCGAAQAVLYWILKYQYEISTSVFYKICAAAVYQSKTSYSSKMLIFLLHIISLRSDIGYAVLQTHQDMKYHQNQGSTILKGSFVFPHIALHIKNASESTIPCIDCVLDTLGFLSNQLSINV